MKYIILSIVLICLYFFLGFYFDLHNFEKYCNDVKIGINYLDMKGFNKNYNYIKTKENLIILSSENPYFRSSCYLTLGRDGKVLSKNYLDF